MLPLPWKYFQNLGLSSTQLFSDLLHMLCERSILPCLNWEHETEGKTKSPVRRNQGFGRASMLNDICAKDRGMAREDGEICVKPRGA